MKNPIVVGIVNAIMPGLGYLILRKRQMFGTLVLLSTLTAWAWGFMYPLPPETFAGASGTLCWATFLLMTAAFAYDAYQLAKNR